MLFFVISFQDIEVISHTLSRSLKASTFEIFIIREPGETSDLEILAVTGHPRPPSQGCKGRREGGRGNESPEARDRGVSRSVS